MLKANLKSRPPISEQNIEGVSKTAQLSCTLGGNHTTPWKTLFAKLRFKKKKGHWTTDVKSTSSASYSQGDRENFFYLFIEDFHTNCHALENEICISNLRIYVFKLQTTGSLYRVGWYERHVHMIFLKQLIMKWNIAIFFSRNLLAGKAEILQRAEKGLTPLQYHS